MDHPYQPTVLRPGSIAAQAPMSPAGRGRLHVTADIRTARNGANMSATVVRYQAKQDRAAENRQLIEAVFADLEERKPDGFTYKVFQLADGVSFVHVVIEHGIENPDKLTDVPAFQAFVAGIADRCDVLPVASAATVVGGYR
jgi:hypothetical protein